MMGTAASWAVSLARVGFVPDDEISGLCGPPWSFLVDELVRTGLSGLFLEAVARDLLEVPDAVYERVLGGHQNLMSAAVRYEAELAVLLPLLESVGGLVWKGPILAHGAYPDALWRGFTDLDIIVPRVCLSRFTGALQDARYLVAWPEPCPGFLLHVAKAVTMRGPSGLLLDVHGTLAPGVSGDTVFVQEIISNAIKVRVGAVEVSAPCWEHHLVACAMHAVLGHGMGRPLAFRDMAEISRRHSLCFDIVADTVQRWEVGHVFASAVMKCVLDFGADFPAEIFDRSQSESLSRRERDEEAAWKSDASRSAKLRLAELRHGSLRRRMCLAQALVLPRPSFLRAFYELPEEKCAVPRLYMRRWQDLRKQAGHREGLS